MERQHRDQIQRREEACDSDEALPGRSVQRGIPEEHDNAVRHQEPAVQESDNVQAVPVRRGRAEAEKVKKGAQSRALFLLLINFYFSNRY